MKRLHPKVRHPAPAIGIDIGKVIIVSDAHSGVDSEFLHLPDDEALLIEPAPGCLDVIAELCARLEQRVWLVSKAGPKIQQKTRLWLAHHDFYRRTHLPEDHVRFCRERAEKRTHAVRLKLTHFIDDRVDVLEGMRDVVPSLLLFGPQTQIPDWAIHVTDWSEIRTVMTDVEG